MHVHKLKRKQVEDDKQEIENRIPRAGVSQGGSVLEKAKILNSIKQAITVINSEVSLKESADNQLKSIQPAVLDS